MAYTTKYNVKKTNGGQSAGTFHLTHTDNDQYDGELSVNLGGFAGLAMGPDKTGFSGCRSENRLKDNVDEFLQRNYPGRFEVEWG